MHPCSRSWHPGFFFDILFDFSISKYRDQNGCLVPNQYIFFAKISSSSVTEGLKYEGIENFNFNNVFSQQRQGFEKNGKIPVLYFNFTTKKFNKKIERSTSLRQVCQEYTNLRLLEFPHSNAKRCQKWTINSGKIFIGLLFEFCKI